MTITIGVDVSKENLDICVVWESQRRFYQKPNTSKAIRQFMRAFSLHKNEVFVVMEATGVYHLRCATMAYEMGFKVGIINPLVIKRYAQMKMMRAKTDRVDAGLITSYAIQHPCDIPLFHPNPYQNKMIKLLKAIDDLTVTKRDYYNRMESINEDPFADKLIKKAYQSIIKKGETLIRQLERELEKLVHSHYSNEYKRLICIKGVGRKTAMIVLAFFGCFEDFESPKQVISYVGTNPNPKLSGSSIKGRGKISKRGHTYLRKYLYMTALSAMITNSSCSRMYQRLKEKGKEHKVARIAVMNKLIRQIFAILKYKRQYDPNYENKFIFAQK